MDSNEIMTVEEVAKYARVSERTVYDWAKRGEIPCGKLGSIWRFKRTDVTKWVNEQLNAVSREDYYTPPIALERILTPERVVFLSGMGKVAALGRLIDILGMTSQVKDKEELARKIFHREELMSTGIGLGIAIPHARLASVTDVAMAVGVCHEPITDYDSLDGQPVDLLFMIAAGERQHAQHIKLLSFLTSRLKNQIFRERLLTAENGENFYGLLLGKERV